MCYTFFEVFDMYGEKNELRVSECYRLIDYYNENYFEFNDHDKEVGKNLVYKIKKSLNEYNRDNKANFVPVYISDYDWNWIIDHKFTSIYETKTEKFSSIVYITFISIIAILIICAFSLLLRSIPPLIALCVFGVLLIFINR